MKRYFVLIALLSLLAVSSLCAFDKGTINPGGSISYTSSKANSDADALSIISFEPQLGYFFMDNICGDLLINYTSMSQGDYSSSDFAVGIGGRYFYNQFYGGLGLMMASSSFDLGSGSVSVSANYIDLKAGYLIPIVENVYVDLGLKYDMGFGDYGGDGSGANEESQIGLNVGFQLFFPFGK